MDLTATHRFTTSPERVATAMLAPDFYVGLQLDDVDPPEVLERTESGSEVFLRIAYAYTGTLDPIARTVLGADRITWVNELHFDQERNVGELTIVPGVQAGRVTCRGRVTLDATPEGATRSIAGALKIGIPLVGGRAERAIAPGILRRLDAEALALAAYLD
jgi:hypothetical protein